MATGTDRSKVREPHASGSPPPEMPPSNHTALVSRAQGGSLGNGDRCARHGTGSETFEKNLCESYIRKKVKRKREKKLVGYNERGG